MSSLSFTKADCKCSEPLFSYKYLRTHRAGGIKLVRCFPHCCPSHSYANFCSTSIDLTSSNVTSGLEGGLAYVRMQLAGDPVFKVGDEIDASVVFDNVRAQDNLKGDWVPSLYWYYAEAKQEMVYHFNQNNCFGWHYGWVGTTKKSHRSLQHHLVGYVFRHAGGKSPPRLHVMASTISPPFIVMSYRRACVFCQKHRPPSDQVTDKPSLDATNCHCEGDLNLKYAKEPVFRKKTHAVCLDDTIILLPLVPRTLPSSSTKQSPLAKRTPRISTPPAISVVVIAPPRTPWMMETQLASLYAVVATPSLGFFPPATFRTLQHHLRRHVLRPFATKHLGLASNNIDEILLPSVLDDRVAVPSSSLDPIDSTLKAHCLDAVLSLVSLPLLRRHADHFTAAADHLLDRDGLLRAYEDWLAMLHDTVSTYVNATQGLEKLVAQLPRLPHPTLQNVLAQWKELPDTAATPGFDYFVAQVREVFMATKISPQPPIVPVMSPYNGRWIYDSTMSSANGSNISIATYLRGMFWGFCFELKLTDAALHMRSLLPAYNTIWSEFQLNGEPQVARVFPNGESTMSQLTSLLLGDYVGLHDNQSDQIRLALFGWPLGNTGNAGNEERRRAMRLSARFQQIGASNLQLQVALYEFTIERNDDATELSEMTAVQRLALYTRRQEVQSTQAAIANFDFRFRRSE
ncbi:Aste57867_196 [Aphanomyces stellatus]|uniref:Aste57867_196 protein n=1 Tax=Aphanomyces stellatus TaxID=120398 RepID=A0A485K372_9STRA|nr:hypothetical protein As57867_000196 [Aphanomyces stellatus]VFT77422.1 Aste57867_196 [Aphanomyces stellatus]